MVLSSRWFLLGTLLILISSPIHAERACMDVLDALISGRPLPEPSPSEVAAGVRAPQTAEALEEISKASDEISQAYLINNAINPIDGKFKLIVNPQEALAARVLMIRNAKDTIDLSYYIFKDTESSRVILTELQRALKRGVNVRMMVDGSGSIVASTKAYAEIQTLSKIRAGLRPDETRATFNSLIINPVMNIRANVKQWYNAVMRLIGGKELPEDHFSIFQRSHDKILLVDVAIPEKSIAIVGGRNISNDYFGIGDAKNNTYNDLDIIIKEISTKKDVNGTIVIENALVDHYNQLFNFAANKRINDFIHKITRSDAALVLRKIKNDHNMYAGYRDGEITDVINKMAKSNFMDEGFDEGKINILNEFENLVRKNPFTQKEYLYANPRSIIKNMFDQLHIARSDILIGSPYLYLTDFEIDRLVSWLKADPKRKLRIMTNSSATSDNLPAQTMMENFVMPKLHAKFWMVDNRAVSVGTSNFDPISRLTNSEVMASVNPTLGNSTVSSLNSFYDELKSRSTRWGSEEFKAVKASPEIKNRIMIQSVLAKIMDGLDILPQSSY